MSTPRKRLSPKAMQTPRRGEPKPPAPDAEPVGDHAITPELVAGPPRRSKAVRVLPGKGPAAAAVIADLTTVLWGEIRGLKDAQASRGTGRLNDDEIKSLIALADATTKVLREERRQNELEDWSRLSEEEIIDMLPDEYRAAFLPATASDEEPSE